MKLSLAIAALSLLARSTTAWNPLTSNPSLSSSNVISNNLADLTSDLSHDPSAQTLTFTHPDFQGHSLEIKAHDKNWCDPDAKSFSGYINTGHGRNLFFTFFESRNKPEDDPVVLWINGGPGCSSMLGMLMELGPCTISDPTNINGTTPNPHSWNNNANLIFLEEPLGVSFSFGNHGQTTSTTEEAAVDVQAFISIFFETFKSYRGREFYLAGESYGGRYLPVFASAVVDGNPILKSKGLTPINLKGVLIGNGITDAYAAQEAYYSYQCLPLPGLPHTPLQPIAKCVQMRKALPYCQEMLQKECIGRFDKTACGAAFAFCGSQFSESFFELGLNPYDVSKPCTRAELSHGLCYGDIMDPITAYLDLPEVRSLLGVSSKVGNFTSCSPKVGAAFHAALDSAEWTWLYVAGLLERGVEVVSYVGTNDWICNYIGNEAWLERLEWTGSTEYKSTELRDWVVDGKVVGQTKSHGGLSFATIVGAGHMVPYDKPVEALAMLNRWIAGGGDAL